MTDSVLCFTTLKLNSKTTESEAAKFDRAWVYCHNRWVRQQPTTRKVSYEFEDAGLVGGGGAGRRGLRAAWEEGATPLVDFFITTVLTVGLVVLEDPSFR